jgi:2-oxoglutarate dehydrogenase E1 component
MSNTPDTFLSGGNIDFIEGLYARYLADPASVDASWRAYFEGQGRGTGLPIYTEPSGRPAPMKGNVHRTGNGHAAAALAPASAASQAQMALQARVDQVVYAFRLRGHLLADIDPLGRGRPPLDHVADIGMVKDSHFTPAELEQVVDTSSAMPAATAKLKDLLAHLRATYCRSIGVEFMQVLNSDARRWLGRSMENSQNTTGFTKADRAVIYQKLCLADGLETFLQTKYLGVKRFSLDGGESLIPMLHAFIEQAAEHGAREVVFGMAHRGRLNVLTNIMGKKADQLLAEFEHQYDARKYLSRGDVKYHQGFSSDHVTATGKKVHLSLAFNPSHLEVVNPVVVGRAKAKQDRAGDPEGSVVVPLLIHGDAAFAGQGIVPETMNFARIPGYSTGGTVHLVINNQVGFTTDPEEGRSSLYATQMAQLLDIPIFHVNGDDAEACVHVMRLATEYRAKFNSDVVIDLVCFRRYGHNEADNPAYTQPKMYELIKAKPTVRRQYGAQLSASGQFSTDEVEATWQSTLQGFNDALTRVKATPAFKEVSYLEGLWGRFKGGADASVPDPETGVDKEVLAGLLRQLAEVPGEFSPHPDVVRTVLNVRKEQADGKRKLQWAPAEMLAYATLLQQGLRLRLTGQDVERGTFTHRHAVLRDVKNGAKFNSLSRFGKSPSEVTVLNSPLSEMGCLGFEFGYSLDYPDALVVWEAQFGDFANNAQVVIDQFIAAAEAKWSRLSGLVMLLPHGYEGQGPEHSSARLERFLELCAQDNMQVCYPSTPAQVFHLLRRQALRPLRKPLVVMSPKSLLRRPGVESTLEELAQGTFQRFIPETGDLDPKAVDRVLLCSGKVYYDLLDARTKAGVKDVAIGRVEQLYPFPAEAISAFLQKFPKLKEVRWVQEEPRNMGSWRFAAPLVQELLAGLKKAPSFGYVGRVESASPATGFLEAHEIEQAQLVGEALRITLAAPSHH